jgi:hypothetical protein
MLSVADKAPFIHTIAGSGDTLGTANVFYSIAQKVSGVRSCSGAMSTSAGSRTSKG